jgi:arylsulfatase A-like enzyme
MDDPVQTLDVFPTLLDVLGETAPGGMLGASLADRIAEPAAGDPRLTLTELHRKDWHKIALRMDGIKYIWDNKAPEEPVIYDLRTDPRERSPLHRDRLPDWPRFQGKIDAHLAMIAGSSTEAGDLIRDADVELLDRLRRLGYVA